MSDDVTDLREFNSLIEKGDPERLARLARQDCDGEVASPCVNDADNTTKNNKMWAIYGGKNYSACEAAVINLPPGQYTIDVSDQIGIFFRATDVNLDELIELPDSVSDEVIKEIELFWSKETHFRSFGFLWKRGVLMWGPAGSGKTSALQIISSRIIAQGGIAVYVDRPQLAAKALAVLRQVEPKRPLIIMLEDVDAIIEEYGESSLLALMGGELQIDNVVFVATTNYPERLDKRFSNRSSRFDIVKKIGMPTANARQIYLTAKNKRLARPENEGELNRWVDLTKDFSVAHIKELIVSVEVFGVPIKTAVERLKTMMDHQPKSSDGEGGKVGFT